MTVFRGTFIDTPTDPFAGHGLRSLDGAILVRDGRIEERGSFSELRSRWPDEDVADLGDGVVLPGCVDAHVHFPQVRIIGALGMPLLEWLERRALPEEARLADTEYAGELARDVTSALVQAGTTSALVFGSHFPDAVAALFTEADRVGLRLTSGLVVSDRFLPEPLLSTPERCVAESLALAAAWHGTGRLRYAVTPRFSLSCSDDLLAACGEVLAGIPGAVFTSHVNENHAEIAGVAANQTGNHRDHYVGTYDRHGLLGPSAVLAHNVHPTESELALLAQRDCAIAHCPSSNAALGSGSFPMRRHVERGIRFGLGTDVGAGTSFSVLREGLQAFFTQQLLGADGVSLSAAHLLYLATSAGARAIGLPDVGDFEVGKRFDALWIRPTDGSTLATALRYAVDESDVVAKVFALAGNADISAVWVDGQRVDAGGADAGGADAGEPA